MSRTLTNTTPSGTVHYIHDLEGNVIAETDGLGNTVREYIWMPSGSGSDSEGKQTISASALPLAVVADVDTTPKLYYVHGDHLNRPIAMMDASKAFVWRAMFLPFGGVHSVTGTAATDSRFPGPFLVLGLGVQSGIRAALQLAPALRPDYRPLSATGPAWYAGWAEPLCLCGE